MKVLALNGSPRKNGNTSMMIDTVLGILEKEDIETEHIRLSKLDIRGCKACYKCAENQNSRCIVDDDMNMVIEKMTEADGIIMGSPTYFANVSTELKSVIDRTGLVAKVNGDLLKRKVGAAVVPHRRAGAVHVFNSINIFFLINQMIVPGSIYWNLAVAGNKGEYENDEEGVRTMQALGENMAWLMKKLQ